MFVANLCKLNIFTKNPLRKILKQGRGGQRPFWVFPEYHQIFERTGVPNVAVFCDDSRAGDVTFRCGKVVFATAAEFKPNHRHQSLTLEGVLEHLLRLQCNDHQTEKATFQNKSLPGKLLEKEKCSWANYFLLETFENVSQLWNQNMYLYGDGLNKNFRYFPKKPFAFLNLYIYGFPNDASSNGHHPPLPPPSAFPM